MTYTQFKDKWLGKRVDADGVYQYQCVDLIRQYIHELYGKPKTGAWGNAIDYWTKTNSNVLQHFDRVASTDARQGDIVVFYGTSGNPYGHIGIVDGQNADSILTLEQNGSSGNGSGVGGDAIRLRWIPKNRVAGLLRMKGSTMSVIPDADNYYWRYGQKLAERLRGRQLSREEFRKHLVGKSDLTAVEILSDDPEADRVQHAQNVGMIAVKDDWQGQIYQLQKNDANLRTAVKEKDSQIGELTKVVGIKDKAIADQLKEIEALKAQVGDNSKWETFKALIRELFNFNNKEQ